MFHRTAAARLTVTGPIESRPGRRQSELHAEGGGPRQQFLAQPKVRFDGSGVGREVVGLR